MTWHQIRTSLHLLQRHPHFELVPDKINHGVEHYEKDLQVIQLRIDNAMLFVFKSTRNSCGDVIFDQIKLGPADRQLLCVIALTLFYYCFLKRLECILVFEYGLSPLNMLAANASQI